MCNLLDKLQKLVVHIFFFFLIIDRLDLFIEIKINDEIKTNFTALGVFHTLNHTFQRD